MSQADLVFCQRLASLTHRKKLPLRRKDSIRLLVQQGLERGTCRPACSPAPR